MAKEKRCHTREPLRTKKNKKQHTPPPTTFRLGTRAGPSPAPHPEEGTATKVQSHHDGYAHLTPTCEHLLHLKAHAGKPAQQTSVMLIIMSASRAVSSLSDVLLSLSLH